MTGRILASLDAWQRGHAVAAVPVAVLKKFLDDRASNLAALMAYYAFFSLFPLMLVFVSVLGFVLEGDPSLQADIVDSTLARIPVIGAQLEDEVAPLTGSALGARGRARGSAVGGPGRHARARPSVPGGLGRAAARAARAGPRAGVRRRRPRRARRPARRIHAAGRPRVGGGIGPAAERLGALSLSLVVNAVAFLAVFGLLTQRPFRIPELLPGVTLAAVGSLILQSIGGWYFDLTVTGASDTYGTFALVIGLLSWFWLGSHLLLVAAEVNVVLRRRLWPRSLTGDLEPADREALRRNAEAARQDQRQEIVVRFDDAVSPQPDDGDGAARR